MMIISFRMIPATIDPLGMDIFFKGLPTIVEVGHGQRLHDLPGFSLDGYGREHLSPTNMLQDGVDGR